MGGGSRHWLLADGSGTLRFVTVDDLDGKGWLVITLYRLRWYLDDRSSAVTMFGGPHRDTPDTRRWRQAMEPLLGELPGWLDALHRVPVSQATRSWPAARMAACVTEIA
ncbi:MAG TPA: hypothetical protein VF838_19015 [Trebonia sp.]